MHIRLSGSCCIDSLIASSGRPATPGGALAAFAGATQPDAASAVSLLRACGANPDRGGLLAPRPDRITNQVRTIDPTHHRRLLGMTAEILAANRFAPLTSSSPAGYCGRYRIPPSGHRKLKRVVAVEPNWPEDYLPDEIEDLLHAASLYHHLTSGAVLGVIATSILLDADEAAYFDNEVECAPGTTVTSRSGETSTSLG